MGTCACCCRKPIELRITITIPEGRAASEDIEAATRAHLAPALAREMPDSDVYLSTVWIAEDAIDRARRYLAAQNRPAPRYP